MRKGASEENDRRQDGGSKVAQLQSLTEQRKNAHSATKIASIMLVNNILIATATAKPTPQGHYYDLHPAPKPIVIQQPYNPVGAVVNPSSTQPLVVGYEEPEPFKPQKRINITLKQSTIAKGNISVWSVGDFATVYEYSGNEQAVLKDVRSKYINYAEQKVNDKVDTLKVSVPKSGLDFTDTGTFLDGVGMVLDIIGCFPVAAEIENWVETGLNITSLTVDTMSLVNDATPETVVTPERYEQVENIKSDISKKIPTCIWGLNQTVFSQIVHDNAMILDF